MMPPRSIAANAICQVIYQGKSLTDVLQQPGIHTLPAAHRALVKDLCFGSLRWHYTLTRILEQLLVKPLKKKDKDVECLLRIGLYQIHYQQTADHAAVNETVNASKTLKKPWSRGLINGVLRRFIRERDSLTRHIKPHTAFPVWLIRHIKRAWPECWKQVLQASNQRAPMTLRVNLRKTTRTACLEQLAAAGISARPHAWADTAIELQQARDVEQIPGFQQGQLSVQDAAAQLAAPLLDIKPGMRVLDACAAPGGKTGHIVECCDELVLTALDSQASRLRRVQDNLQRLGYAENTAQRMIEQVAADASQPDTWYDGQPYERILLDAPCSALGVMRRHPDIKILRQANDIPALVAQQQQLLESLWQVLAPEGLLLYATCSILPEENDLQIKAFIQRHPQDARVIPIQATWGHACSYGRQILPHDNNTDGFYYSLLQKTAVLP